MNDEGCLSRAVRALLMLDPNFEPHQFIQTEFYKDLAIAKNLEAELNEALETTSLRRAG
jgi:hypothetical protein